MRIAIVNDSLLAVESLRRVVVLAPNYHVAWIARDGQEAVTKCAEDTPDLILMDLIMPIKDGVAATREIMANTPCAILVITACVAGNAGKVFEAMGAGALDALNTPVLGSDGDGQGKDQLLGKIGTIEKLIASKNKFKPHFSADKSPKIAADHNLLLAIGASTGGPAAVANILSSLPADFPGAVVVVQHMDVQFLDSFVKWMDEQTPLTAVRLARPGDIPTPGTVLVAGSEQHLTMDKDETLGYTPDPVEYPYKPSVDVFFDSVAANWTGGATGVLLTGMGRDGAKGLLELRQRGFLTIAQDEASSAVYGMPKAAVDMGAAMQVLALDRITPLILREFNQLLKVS